jgi:predicted small secreted protein
LPAREREFQLGKAIFRPEKIYVGPGNAKVDPRPIYAGRDIKYAGRNIKYAGRDIKYAGRVKSSAGPEMLM